MCNQSSLIGKWWFTIKYKLWISGLINAIRVYSFNQKRFVTCVLCDSMHTTYEWDFGIFSLVKYILVTVGFNIHMRHCVLWVGHSELIPRVYKTIYFRCYHACRCGETQGEMGRSIKRTGTNSKCYSGIFVG